MTIAVEEKRIRSLFERIETVEDVACSLAEDDERRARLLAVSNPPDNAGRDKPPCCDELDELPPVLGPAITEILERAVRLRKTRRS